MSLRIRTDGAIVCAAMHPPLPDDVYIHDGVSYVLSVERRIVVTEPMHLPDGVGMGGHAKHGLWWWRGEAPASARLEHR